MDEYRDQILSELKNIVGDEWASDDPEITYAYSRDVNLYPENLSTVMRPPFYVVLPGTTEEVQKIVAVAKTHKIPLLVQTTGLNIAGVCVPTRASIMIDLKRMDKVIEIDEQTMTATIQPYVTIARLSCELQKRGMFLPVPGNPSTAKSSATKLNDRSNGEPLRVLSEADWTFWITNGTL